MSKIPVARFELRHPTLTPLGGSPAVSRPLPSPLARDSDRSVTPHFLYTVSKRLVDIVLVLLVGLVALPFIPLLALAIKLDSRGPVFYSQMRVGLNDRLFRIYKFRSMRVDAELMGVRWAEESDPRVTRVGRFLRRSRFDELPQLWNVLRGDMTFVGPRPERPEFTCMLEAQLPSYRTRHQVKPGLTGWAQVRYRYASSVQDSAVKLEHDLYYVQHRSLWLDIRIMLLTFPVVFNLRGL